MKTPKKKPINWRHPYGFKGRLVFASKKIVVRDFTP